MQALPLYADHFLTMIITMCMQFKVCDGKVPLVTSVHMKMFYLSGDLPGRLPRSGAARERGQAHLLRAVRQRPTPHGTLPVSYKPREYVVTTPLLTSTHFIRKCQASTDALGEFIASESDFLFDKVGGSKISPHEILSEPNQIRSLGQLKVSLVGKLKYVLVQFGRNLNA